jgi:hypothetical protein
MIEIYKVIAKIIAHDYPFSIKYLAMKTKMTEAQIKEPMYQSSIYAWEF